jgi:hypothetical protein
LKSFEDNYATADVVESAVTALPHRVRQDDYYKGMLIPKDSTVFIPTWAIHHTEEIFEENERFNPDRFLHYPKLASEYAGSANWEDRDKFIVTLPSPFTNISRGFTSLRLRCRSSCMSRDAFG